MISRVLPYLENGATLNMAGVQTNEATKSEVIEYLLVVLFLFHGLESRNR